MLKTTPDVPATFAEGFAQEDRNRLWREEVADEVTRVAKEGPVPSGIEQFDEAWRRLGEDRPNKPPHKCRLRRKLIRKFFWAVSSYDAPDTQNQQ